MIQVNLQATVANQRAQQVVTTSPGFQVLHDDEQIHLQCATFWCDGTLSHFDWTMMIWKIRTPLCMKILNDINMNKVNDCDKETCMHKQLLHLV